MIKILKFRADIMFNLFHANHKYSIPQKDMLGYQQKSPYVNKVHESILDFVGHTPLIKLTRIPKDYGIACEIYAKCEFMNPAGSSKDRIALAMLHEAERTGHIHENTKFVEATSGNTGIGIAFNAALIEKESYIVMGLKNSTEKVNTMKVLGANVITTKGSAGEVARQIKDDDPVNMVMLEQFENSVNPRIHYETTAVEILDALDNVVDMFVAGAGTGGTISGVGQKMKEKCPKCFVIVPEPEGSTMFNHAGKQHPFLIEGIGGSVIPINLDKSVVDGFEIVSDKEAFLMAREIIRKEGLLCGGSGGAAMVAAIKAIKTYKISEGQRVVVLLPDGMRNYMTKFVTDQWMEAHLFIDPPQQTMKWWQDPVTNLTLKHTYPIINPNITCADAIHKMKPENIAIVTEQDNNFFVGAVTKDDMRSAATNPRKLPKKNTDEFNFNDLVSEHYVKDCYTLAKNNRKKGMPTIGLLSRMLDITPFVVIGTNVNDAGTDKFVPESVATADDVLDYIFAYRSR